jgi:hypothetical protein
VTISWRKPLADGAAELGVPEHEIAEFLLKLGLMAFNRNSRTVYRNASSGG